MSITALRPRSTAASRDKNAFVAKASTQDNLDLYLKDLERCPPPFPADEEREIARRMKAGDHEARELLIKANLRFVVSFVKRYRDRGLSYSDLIQHGNAGLVIAADKFDPEAGVKFISYAVWWIRQQVLAALAEAKVARIPLNRMEDIKRCAETRRKLTQAFFRDATVHDIAEELAMPAEEVAFFLAVATAPASLDAPVGDEDGEVSIYNFHPQIAEDPLVRVENAQRREIIHRELSRLRPREAKILRLYYGLSGPEMTLEQIGQEIGVTRERVRQIHNGAVDRLHRGLRRVAA